MLFVLCLPNAYGQSIDFSVKVATGISVITADLKVEIVEGISAINADMKVEIVTGLSAINADKTICIYGADELDMDTLRKLKLVE